MTVFEEEVPANFVPAAAVKRGGQALFVRTGCKGSVDCHETVWKRNALGSTF